MRRRAKEMVKQVLNRYPRWVCRREFESQTFVRINERPVEFAFVFRNLAQFCPRTVLDVGTGTTALPHLMRNCGFLVTATDNIRDYWPLGMVNRHYHVLNDDITATRLSGRFDFITCVSVLEHIRTPDVAFRNMVDLLNPGGHLVLSFPYTEGGYVRNVYDLPGSSYGQDNPYITQSYSRAELNRWCEEAQVRIMEQEYWRFWTGAHWTVGEPVVPPVQVTARDAHQITCLLIRKDEPTADGV